MSHPFESANYSGIRLHKPEPVPADDPQGVICPVCLFPAMPHEPAPLSYHICPCCGTEFGYDDASFSHAELRERWKAAGCPWWSKRMAAPEGWSAELQLLGLNERVLPGGILEFLADIPPGDEENLD